MQDINQEKLNLRQMIHKIWIQDSFTGFYRGVVPGTIKVLPATSIVFVVYERARIWMKD